MQHENRWPLPKIPPIHLHKAFRKLRVRNRPLLLPEAKPRLLLARHHHRSRPEGNLRLQARRRNVEKRNRDPRPQKQKSQLRHFRLHALPRGQRRLFRAALAHRVCGGPRAYLPGAGARGGGRVREAEAEE